MTYETSGFNPIKLGDGLVKRISGSTSHFIDEPVFAAYNVGRYFKNGSKWGDAFMIDALGCNLRCAHCFGHNDALTGKISSDFVKSKVDNLPKKFRGSAIHSADDIFDYLLPLLEKKKTNIIEFTGGEPTFYRGGLKRMSELAKHVKKGITVGVNTNGLLIAEFADYLEAFEGLQDALYFYVSIKGTSPEEFKRFTSANGNYYDHPFIAIKRLLERGFRTIPGGIVLNTFADESAIEEKDNPITRLYSRLSEIHPLLPGLISYDQITYGRVYQPEEQIKRMRERGYVDCKPSMVENALFTYFEEKGTPIIKSGKGELPGMITKKRVLEEVINSFC
jgi:uncharacterized Fe-S cluster-containing radical SAM superfamily protein